MTIRYLEVPVSEYGSIIVEIQPTDSVAALEDLGVVEIRPASSSGFEELGIKDELVKASETAVARATQAFDQVSDTIRVLACGFHQSIHEIERKMRPDEVSVEFAIGIKADTGVTITGLWEASGGGEANFKVTLVWKEEQDEKTE